ncbi:MAG: hypothetical protein WC880_01920 [Candidatus Paceibacterota bacterium]
MQTLANLDFGTRFHAALNFIIGFGHDFLPFIIVAALVAAFAFFLGRNRLMPLIAAIYTAVPLYLFFPFQTALLQDHYIAIALYLLFVFLSFVAFSGLSFFMASAPRSFLRVGAMSILVAGALLAIGIHVLPLEQIYVFNPATKALFSSNQSFFWWLLAPLAGLFFLER